MFVIICFALQLQQIQLVEGFACARSLLIGINAGINTGLAPMYLTEIAPVHLRGAVGTIHQLVVTISILISQLLGLPAVFGNAQYWDLLFGFVLVPCVFQILTLPFCPESPRFLFLYREREDEAHRGKQQTFTLKFRLSVLLR